MSSVRLESANDRSDVQRAVLTADEVARMLRISKHLVYDSVKKNQLPYLKFGARIIFPRALILRLFEGGNGNGVAADPHQKD